MTRSEALEQLDTLDAFWALEGAGDRVDQHVGEIPVAKAGAACGCFGALVAEAVDYPMLDASAYCAEDPPVYYFLYGMTRLQHIAEALGCDFETADLVAREAGLEEYEQRELCAYGSERWPVPPPVAWPRISRAIREAAGA